VTATGVGAAPAEPRGQTAESGRRATWNVAAKRLLI
jgi:hypothetical protein